MIKLQLDKDALERLIGGDSQVEMDLRSGIVQNFAKRYLKGVAHQEIMTTLSAKVQGYVREQLKEQLNIPNWGTWTPPPQMQEGIRQHIVAKINGIISDAVNVHAAKMQQTIQTRLDEIAYRIEMRLTEKVMEERIMAEVTRRLRIAAGARDAAGDGDERTA